MRAASMTFYQLQALVTQEKPDSLATPFGYYLIVQLLAENICAPAESVVVTTAGEN